MSIAQYVTRVRLQEEGKAVMARKQNYIGKNLTPELMLTSMPKKVVVVHTTCSLPFFSIPLLK